MVILCEPQRTVQRDVYNISDALSCVRVCGCVPQANLAQVNRPIQPILESTRDNLYQWDDKSGGRKGGSNGGSSKNKR